MSFADKKSFIDIEIPAEKVTGKLTLAQLVAEVCSETEAAALIAAKTHPVVVRKTTDESTNSTSLQNDDELFLPVEANEVWRLDVFMRMPVPDPGGVISTLGAWSLPSGATMISCNVWGGRISYEDIAPEATYQYRDDEGGGHLRLLYVGGASSGNIQFQFRTDNATYPVTVKANAYIIATKLA